MHSGERARVMRDVILDERFDEVVAVVVAFMAPHRHRLAGPQAGSLENVRMQLIAEEFIAQTLIDEDARFEASRVGTGDELACIVLPPCLTIVAEITRKRLLAP